MMGLHGKKFALRPARARRTGIALGAGVLALCAACSSYAPPPPPAPIEVLRNTAEDGSVRYTIKRSRSAADAPASQESASPAGGESESPDVEPGPGDQIRSQLEQDREFLRRLISRDPRKGIERSQDPRLREIAERVPRLQAELEALENEPAP